MGNYKSLILTPEVKIIWEIINREKPKETSRLSNNKLECIVLKSRLNGERGERLNGIRKKIEKNNREKDCGRLKSDNHNEKEMQTEKNRKGRLNKRDK